nr:hypothetical protein [Tanacetum cinerariifolium]
MATPAALPEIAPEAAAAGVVAPPIAIPDPDIEFDPEVEPSEAPPSEAPHSPNYVPYFLILALASPDYHPGSDIKSEPMKDESEPIKDAPEVAKPLFAQIAPSPPVHSTPIVPFFEPMRPRPISSLSSSLSGTLPAPSGPLSRRRHLVSSYSTPSASARLSRKRCRSLTTSRSIAASTPVILPSVHVDCLPPRKRERDTIMSDSEDSTVTYTTVSSPYVVRSGDVSPREDGPPVMPEDPYAYVVAAFQALPPPDYVPSPEEPEQAPPSPVYIPYVPEPEYLEYIPPEDEVFPAEEQPLPTAASPTVDSPGYIPESDPDEDPEDDDDEDPEEDPTDYPNDHDDDDDEEEEPSGDDADKEDDEQDEDDNDEEEEHSALADSIPPPHALRITAKISFRPQPPTLSFTKEDVERFLTMPIPLLLPLTPLSSPLPQIPSPPLPTSPPILPIPLPAASPPVQLLSFDRESSAAVVARPIEGRRADYGFVGFLEAEIRRRIAEDIRYGIRDTWIDLRDVAEEEALTTLEGVNTRVTELAAVQEQDTQDIYRVMEDAQGVYDPHVGAGSAY